MNFNTAFDRLLYYVMLPIVCITFTLTNLTNDTRIFIGAEAIADTYYQLPYGWDAAYEVKPIGNRILNWVLYKVANAFVPFTANDYTHFGLFVKLTALIILLVCCWYIAKKIPFVYGFPFLVIAFACQANFGIMMSEWFAVLFSFVGVALCFEKNKNWQYLASVLFIFIGLLKGITCFMIVPAICAVYILGGTVDWKRAIAGFFAGGLTYLALCFTVWPYSLGDILLSRYVAHIGAHSWVTLFKYFWVTQDSSWLPGVFAYYIPVLLLGSIIGVAIFLRYYTREEKRNTILFGLMWLVPVGIVFAQNEFIVYHYLVLMFPALMSFILMGRKRT